MNETAPDRHDRECQFHNQAFGHNTRASVSKLYQIMRACQNSAEYELVPDRPWRHALECGCGQGRHAGHRAARCASAVGIDISDVAIDRARSETVEEGLANVTFEVMNAEDLQFASDEFDLLCSAAILYHLDLHKALQEMSRALKPTGKAVFIEPPGHNPAINLYRRMTPHLRTPDEHPLLTADREVPKLYFRRVRHQFFTLISLLAVLFHGRRGARLVLDVLEPTDRALFTLVLPARRLA